jgi:glyoxylase-like metal-dependent hydrolase (beta-lactamase superfamily II)
LGAESLIGPTIQHFYDEPTGTLSYVVVDAESSKAAIIDCVLGYSLSSGRTDTSPADVVLDYVRERKLSIGGTVGIGVGISNVQSHFAPIYNYGENFPVDGRQFDHLFAAGDVFKVGELDCEVIATPGHTDDSVSYKIGSHVFVGDSMFMPDFGTARCDFPGGDAGLLYDSISTLLALPGDTLLYMCHDYMPGGRELRYCCTVEEQRRDNLHVNEGVSKEDFIAMRNERDASLGLPALIVPAIQVNIRAGHLPDAEDNGIAYLTTPIDTF